MTGSQRLVCEMTIRDGKIVYDINARALCNWQNAPEEYWHSPGVIKKSDGYPFAAGMM